MSEVVPVVEAAARRAVPAAAADVREAAQVVVAVAREVAEAAEAAAARTAAAGAVDRAIPAARVLHDDGADFNCSCRISPTHGSREKVRFRLSDVLAESGRRDDRRNASKR